MSKNTEILQSARLYPRPEGRGFTLASDNSVKKLRIIQCPTLSSDEFKEVKEWLLSDKTWMIQKFGAWQTLKVYLTDEETFNLKLKFRGINISG